MSCWEQEIEDRSNCIRSRDNGYESCSRREDRGYSQCCDWFPCNLICSALVWISNIVCVAYTWVAQIVCLAYATIKKLVCDVVEFVIMVVEEIARIATAVFNFLKNLFFPPKPYYIAYSTESKRVASSLQPQADAWSAAFSIEQRTEASRFRFRDTGRFLRYTLSNETVLWNAGSGDLAGRTYQPDNETVRSNSLPIDGAVCVSYQNVRAGEFSIPPAFDMIAASADRVIAKEAGKANYYISVPTHLYLHQTRTGNLLVLPQTCFINDPQLGKGEARLQDLINPITVAFDDEIHPATSRFPFYRALFRLLENPLAKENGNLREKFTQMDIRLLSRVWVRMETRPAKNSYPVPVNYVSYDHVTYRNGPDDSADIITRQSIDYNTVLSLGVGVSHFHEQYDDIYGGEMDTLDEWSPVGSWNTGYRLANGPIEDIGGWVDGTCIYYQLVEVPFLRVMSDSNDREMELQAQLDNYPVTEIPNRYFAGRYLVLWIDEQQAFNERWRALGFQDFWYQSFVKPVSANLSKPENNPIFHFNEAAYLDPMAKGFIRPFSRMAVARQVIIINGYDFDARSSQPHRLYSIHFCWPTMDRTWRWRPLPTHCEPVLLTSKEMLVNDWWPFEPPGTDAVLPQSVALREDMTIYLRGQKLINGYAHRGRWVQKYLPANCGEVPSEQNLQANENATSDGYYHPWTFYEEEVFQKMHSWYSHFGVYQNINSRCQFYTVRIEDNDGINEEELETFVWADEQHGFTRTHRKISWARIADILDRLIPILAIAIPILVAISVFNFLSSLVALLALLGLSVTYIITTNPHPSYFEPVLYFKMRKITHLGYIMWFYDKREDKTIRFDHVASAGDKKLSSKAHTQLTATHDPTKKIYCVSGFALPQYPEDIYTRQHYCTADKLG
ncbi:hypothetical protein [Foetidibacter luteolus]|uniref:hypothetical protein n=1 Tax=Foetidibacter luteolus TaxID=2608880 RepID=UPI00129BA450|nr:hypothetical protein [Foetidibacter luteolus]